MNARRRLTWASAGAGLFLLAYLLGAFSHARNLWPIEVLRSVKQQFAHAEVESEPDVNGPWPQFDRFNRLVDFPIAKQEVPCPTQDPGTMVLLLIGQSNAANSHGQRYASSYGDKVINYFDGSCVIAASPLLGATDIQGETWTLLGNRLLAAGMATQVILVPAAVGSSSIDRWQAGGDLNAMLLATIEGVIERYRITHVLWHQGEADFARRTETADYEQMFTSMVGSMRDRGVAAPVFISVATKCPDYGEWTPANPVAMAQQSLASTGRNAGILPGVNTDALLDFTDRRDDCHFSATGQEKFADGWLAAMRAHSSAQ